jgi:hypothetical protein
MKSLTDDHRKKLLEETIERLKAGEVVEVNDASFCSFDLCIGDFRNIGLAKKNVWRTGTNWTWNGPGSILLSGEVVSSGQESQEIDMDWS